MTSVDRHLRQRIFRLVTDDNEVSADKSGLFNELVNLYTEYLLTSVDADVAYMQASVVDQYMQRFDGETPTLSWLNPVSEGLSRDLQDVAEDKLREAEGLWNEVEAAYKLLLES